jgi:hypothetical protein
MFREYFTGVLPDAHPEERRAAIILLGMCATSEVSIVTSNIQVFSIVRYPLRFGADPDPRIRSID